MIPDKHEEVGINTGWKDAKIILQQKRLGNSWKIDVRIWVKDKLSDTFYPTKKGITLENSVWNDKIWPEMVKLIDKYV